MKSIDHRMMRWLLLLASVLLLNACSDDAPSDQDKELVQLELKPYASSYIVESDSAVTRAGDTWEPPSTYVTYDHINSLFENQKNLMGKSIKVFFTQDNADPLERTFSYRNGYNGSEGSWQLMEVPTDHYFLYGFIPKEDAASAIITPNGSYSNGAVLTIEGLNTVTPSDVCVLIGAKDGPSSISDGPEGDRLRPGYFETQIKAENNYIYLLFDHLYASLRFNFKVDPTYAALRTIRLRKLELVAYKDGQQTSVSAKFNAEITLLANNTGSSPIVGSVRFTPVTSSASVPPVTLFEWDGTVANEVTLSTTTPTSFMGCFVPGDNTYFKLRSTYDVYDNNTTTAHPEGNLVRQGCQAENTIDLRKWFGNDLTTTRGHSYSLTLTVQPTYLYVLSDPDLDNPTLKISI